MVDSIQLGADGAAGLFFTVGGWVLRMVLGEQKSIKDAHERLVDTLPNTYARRDDVKDKFDDLKGETKAINAKLDQLLLRG